MMSAAASATDPQHLLAEALGAIRKLRRRVAELEGLEREPIAVIGMSCRLPGGIESPEQLWTALERGTDLIEEIPPDRWDKDAYYDPNPQVLGKICTRHGGFVRRPDLFDAAFFRVSPREAMFMDPQQRLLLEVAWEALEHASVAPDRLYGSDSGVFMGLSSVDYSGLLAQHGSEAMINPWLGTGLAHSAASGRISYALGLQGPSLTLDTACSSSLVTAELACQSLRRRECSLALAGGVNLMLTPHTHVVFSLARMLAPDGHCKTFDDAADGYVRSDGAGVVVLKRLSDALAAGDRIWAVIRGGAINQDGASGGLTVPNGPAQQRVVRSALENAGVGAADLGYIEAHGTGTALGDPIELNALGEILAESHDRTRPVFVGSVKTNLGHTEPAAGIVGLIKLVLQIERGTIVPHLHFKTPSRRIAWDDLPIEIPTSPRPWPLYGERRIGGISSFGFTGTNAHLIVEEPPSVPHAGAGVQRPYHVLCLSARSETALGNVCEAYATRLQGSDDSSLGELCHAANSGRSHFPQRVAVIAASRAEAATRLAEVGKSNGKARVLRGRADALASKVAFLFTGQGSQYPEMGRGLYETEPVFRAELERCDRILTEPLGGSLLEALYAKKLGATELNQTRLAQPLVVALELALVALLRSWGIRPAFVLGHSVGEYTAACVAGVLGVEDTLRLIAARGRAMQAVPEAGSMLAAQCDEALALELIEPHRERVAIAALNGPSQTVLAGAEGALLLIERALSERGVACQRLQVSHAFHSPLMRPALSELAAALRRCAFSKPELMLISNASGKLAGDEIGKPEYWLRHASEPVRFGASLETLHGLGCRVFLELGPRSTLTRFTLGFDSPSPLTRVCSLDPRRPDAEQVREALGALYVAGVPIDFGALDRDAAPRKVSIPTYPFDRQRYWLAQASGGFGAREQAARVHPLLSAPRAENERLAFESELTLARFPYLGDHRLFGQAVFPAAGYVELGLGAARDVFGNGEWCVKGLTVQSPLRLEQESVRVLRTWIEARADGCHEFQVSSRERDEASDGAWEHHARGEVEALVASSTPAPESLAALESRIHEELDVAAIYAHAARYRGIQYGEAFRAIRAGRRDGKEVLGKLGLDAGLAGGARDYVLHPILLDAAFQLVGAVLPEEPVAYLPVAIDRVEYRRPLGAEATAHIVVRALDDEEAALNVDLTLYDGEGAVGARVSGLLLQRTSEAALKRAIEGDLRRLLYELNWIDKPAPEAPALDGEPRSWLVFADRGGLGASLVHALRARGDRCHVVQPAETPEPRRVDGGQYLLNPAHPEHFSALARLLAEHGESPSASGGILYLWALDLPALIPGASFDLEAGLLGCGALLEITKAFFGDGGGLGRLFLITRGAVATRQRPEIVNLAQAAVPGMIATIQDESPLLSCRHVDLDPLLERRTLPGEAARLADEVRSTEREEQLAFRANQRLVARLEPLPRVVTLPPDGAVEVTLTEYGSPDHLVLAEATRRPPGPGEVEIAVRAGGLNFKDVLQIWGLLKALAEETGKPWVDRRKLGFECAGIVARVGAGVTAWKPGDAVIAIGTECLAHYVTLPAEALIAKPERLGFTDAAAIPIAFVTASYALDTLARLRPGDTVLIHAAAGGVGQAAIELCRRVGARVFATASPSKWDFLRARGVSDVMSSRTLDFEAQVREKTGGRGVDVILNSLTGDFIPASLAVLAPGGRFVEIGKRGIWSPERVASARPDAAYFTFDLGEVGSEVTRLFPEILRRVSAELESGAIAPPPVSVFPVENVRDAFRELAQARNIGKVVVEFAPPPSDGASRREPRPLVRPDAAYVVTGGLGGLGLEVADWLVSRGARRLVLVGRRSASEAARERMLRLTERGAHVEVCEADVAARADVVRLLRQVEALGVPLAGIVHAAGQLDDALLADQTWQRCLGVMRPKVLGTWHLHDLTRDLPLDFFVCFSSIAGTLGTTGQVAYAAGNRFMDVLMQERKAGGCPGRSVGFGPWASVGMAARLPEAIRAMLQARGVRPIGPRKNLALLEQALTLPNAHALVADIDWATFARHLEPRPVPAYLDSVAGREVLGDGARAFGDEGAQGPGALAAALERTTGAAERKALLLGQVRAMLARVLRFKTSDEIDPRAGFFDLGIDSLSALEVKTRLEVGLGRKLAATALMNFATPEALSTYIHDDVLGYAAPAASSTPQQG